MHRVVDDAPGLLGYTGQGMVYVDAVTCALRNAGENICYLNATLHVLARVPAIRNWAVEHLELFAGGCGCVLCALGQDLLRLTVSDDPEPCSSQIALTPGVWSSGAFAGTRRRMRMIRIMRV